jgi:hypothetical protein
MIMTGGVFFSLLLLIRIYPSLASNVRWITELMSVRTLGNWVERVEQIDSHAKQGPRAAGAGSGVGAWEPGSLGAWEPGSLGRGRLDGMVHFHEPANERAGRAPGRNGHSVISTSAAPGQQPPGIYVVRCIRVQGDNGSVVASG